MSHDPCIGQYRGRGDGSYLLYVGGLRGWILCDDHKELQAELEMLESRKGVEHEEAKSKKEAGGRRFPTIRSYRTKAKHP